VVEQLGRLVGAGIPVRTALKDLADAASGQRLHQALDSVILGLEGGEPLGVACGHAPALFDEGACGVIAVGERTGRLPEVFQRLATGLRRSWELRRALISGTIYPAILVALSAIITPLPVLFLSGTAAYLREAGTSLLVLGAVVGFAASLPALVRLTGSGPFLRRVAWGVPGIRWLYRKKAVADLASFLSTGLSAGLGVHEALTVASDGAGDPTLATACKLASGRIAIGEEFAAAMAFTRVLPPAAHVMLAGGERSGTLADSLARLSEDLTREFQEGLKVGLRIANVVLLVAVILLVAGRLFRSAQGMLPGGGGDFDEIEKLLEREGPKIIHGPAPKGGGPH
jgi:type II secretory pathway component PulF